MARMVSKAVNVGNLDQRRPGEVCSVPVDGQSNLPSMATLYASYSAQAENVIALGLYARLGNVEQLVGRAGIPPGYNGIAVLATGIVADAWVAKAYGLLVPGLLSVVLGARECCSGHRVVVPAELQTSVPYTRPTVAPAIMPLARGEGLYNLRSGIAGTENIADAERVTRVVATADPAAIALVSGVGLAVWNIPMGMTGTAEPLGNLQGPRALVFVNTVYYQVETVR